MSAPQDAALSLTGNNVSFVQIAKIWLGQGLTLVFNAGIAREN
jgi:hypothetical protein